MERDRDRASVKVESELRWGWREREREMVLFRGGSREREDAAGRVFWRLAFRFWSSGGGVPDSVSSENRECWKTLL